MIGGPELKPSRHRSPSPRSSGPSEPIPPKCKPHGVAASRLLRGVLALPLLGAGGHPPVRGIHDEGRLPGREDARSVVEPEVVVVGRRQVFGVQAFGELRLVDLLLDRHFLVRELGPAAELGGALERRGGAEVVHPLEIRRAPGRARDGVRRGLRANGQRQQDDQADGKRDLEGHGFPPSEMASGESIGPGKAMSHGTLVTTDS